VGGAGSARGLQPGIGTQSPLGVQAAPAQEVSAESESSACPIQLKRQGHQHTGPCWASANSLAFLLVASTSSILRQCVSPVSLSATNLYSAQAVPTKAVLEFPTLPSPPQHHPLPFAEIVGWGGRGRSVWLSLMRLFLLAQKHPSFFFSFWLTQCLFSIWCHRFRLIFFMNEKKISKFWRFLDWFFIYFSTLFADRERVRAIYIHLDSFLTKEKKWWENFFKITTILYHPQIAQSLLPTLGRNSWMNREKVNNKKKGVCCRVL